MSTLESAVSIGYNLIEDSIRVGTIDPEGIVTSAEYYTTQTIRWRLSDVKLNGSALNSTTNIPDSFTYTVRDNRGAALSPANTGNFSYNSTDQTWDASITLPSTPGRYHLHAAVAKGTSAGFEHRSIVARSRL